MKIIGCVSQIVKSGFGESGGRYLERLVDGWEALPLILHLEHGTKTNSGLFQVCILNGQLLGQAILTAIWQLSVACSGLSSSCDCPVNMERG